MGKWWTVLVFAGLGLVLLSLVLPLVQPMGPQTGIIGGAGFPTYLLILQQKYLWLTGLGGIVGIGALVGLLRARKK